MIIQKDTRNGKLKVVTFEDFFKLIKGSDEKVLKTFWEELSRGNIVAYKMAELTFPVQHVQNMLRFIEITAEERGVKLW